MLMTICNTPKYLHIRDIRFNIKPYLMRSLVFNCRGWSSVNGINGCGNSFCPEVIWQVSFFQHASSHAHNCSIFSFHNTIVLWCMRFTQLPSNTILFAEGIKFIAAKFSTSIRSQHFQTAFTLLFNQSFKNFKSFKSIRFF
ncbi:hypothetical protein HanPI659440_Chr02g0087931 [Helianthus annuus]|nr:hypothetical protein HanPI659440_Chr02g0087931 [Helianthus annuus]